eukprot:CAMPEP_0185211052 /NCGR_PEP_ID=MMETSP1140-20130426/66828_1 /TAXON_ID=298111 /ORGANISM="Pavlova sp., Strain CCMP459" /LENGTH=139 /DNA_ID=CAMNT_0027778891 /DNA_START=63 /DNA_END=482 /DNA_ORIENTATION=-
MALDEPGMSAEEDPEDARLKSVFRGVLGASDGASAYHHDLPGDRRPRMAKRAAQRRREARVRTTEFFYRRDTPLPATANLAEEHSLGQDVDPVHVLERERVLMTSLGLPTTLVKGTAMSEDRDGRGYSVLPGRTSCQEH